MRLLHCHCSTRLGKHGPTPASPTSFPQHSPSRACCTQGCNSPELFLGVSVLLFYGFQAVIWPESFIHLWPLPGFQVCYLIMGFRNQSVCTGACIWSQGRVSSGQVAWEGQQVQLTCCVSKATGNFSCSAPAGFLSKAKL